MSAKNLYTTILVKTNENKLMFFNYYYLDSSIYFPIHKTIFKYWITTYKLCVSILPVEGGERWGEGGRVVLYLARTIYMPPRERYIILLPC